uniref:C-type lectin domain-containing protein n=1 Tax=Anabas testudineus TaxID=64144 RepID=A0A3Q1JZW3_ANATE
MKMLTVSLLVCAMMALTRAAGEKSNFSVIVHGGGSTRAASCPSGWTAYNGRCFLYVPTEMTWADAEKNCLYHGGNLASVHSFEEHHVIQSMILKLTHAYPLTWIGGSDAQQEGTWFWSDGTAFRLQYWAPGQPNNLGSGQHCLLMNFGDLKKFEDHHCSYRKASVCAKKQ